MVGSQWSHDRQKKTICLSYRLHRRENDWEYPNLVGHTNLCFQSQRCHSVKKGTAGTKDAGDYDKLYRRTTRSESELQLSPGSALLTGTQIPKGPKPETAVNRNRSIKKIRKSIGRVRGEKTLREVMAFATSSRTKPEQAGQSKTCLQLCITVERTLPERKATIRKWCAIQLDLKRYSDFVKDQ